MHCSIPFFLSSSLALTCAHAGGIYKMWKHVGKTVCGRNGWCDTNFITVLAARKKMKKKLREKSRSEASDEWSIQNCWWLTLFSLRALHSYYFCVGKRKGKWRVRSPINIQSKEPWQLDRTEGNCSVWADRKSLSRWIIFSFILKGERRKPPPIMGSIHVLSQKKDFFFHVAFLLASIFFAFRLSSYEGKSPPFFRELLQHRFLRFACACMDGRTDKSSR